MANISTISKLSVNGKDAKAIPVLRMTYRDALPPYTLSIEAQEDGLRFTLGKNDASLQDFLIPYKQIPHFTEGYTRKTQPDMERYGKQQEAIRAIKSAFRDHFVSLGKGDAETLHQCIIGIVPETEIGRAISGAARKTVRPAPPLAPERGTFPRGFS